MTQELIERLGHTDELSGDSVWEVREALKKQADALERLTAERDALAKDAALRYTAWQSPHDDDYWLEHPADCEIIDRFHPPVHVGFEYELTAGSYTTQRYRVTKIADEESDDVEVELIAKESKT